MTDAWGDLDGHTGFDGLSVAVEFDVAESFQDVVDFCQLAMVVGSSICGDGGGVQGEGAVGRLFEGAAGDAARAVDALDGFEMAALP